VGRRIPLTHRATDKIVGQLALEEHEVDNLENSGTFIVNFLSSIGFEYSYSAGLNRAEGC
jgi:hypothetical protein